MRNHPFVGSLVGRACRRLFSLEHRRPPFSGSAKYWQDRYASGGDSGVGSYSKFAAFKAEVLNSFVETHSLASVVEFGCGDGNQLSLARYPRYLGLDVCEAIIRRCKERFATDENKRFCLLHEYKGEKADLALSLDVIYHLVEDAVFTAHMTTLFRAANRYVIIYSSDTDDNPRQQSPHVRHRQFSRWVSENASGWSLIERVPNRYPYEGDYTQGSLADFFIYQTTEDGPSFPHDRRLNAE